MSKITVTKHGKQRLRERAGIKGSAAEKTAERAFARGIRREDTAGNLYKWLTHLYCSHENIGDLRVYNYKVYVFDEGRFVTVLNLPREYKNGYEKARGKLNKESRDKEREENQMSEMTISKEAGSMNELCTINNTAKTPIEVLLQVDDAGTVSSKNVYEFLELNPAHYARWCKANILDNEFAEENVDFAPFTINGECGGQSTTDYRLAVSFAKKLCMKQGNERGEQARNYFIKVEDKLKEIALFSVRPMTPAEITLMLAQQQVELEQRQREQQVALTAVEKRMDNMSDIIRLNPNGWRDETQAMIPRIARALGGVGFIRDVYSEIYQLIDKRFKVNLKQRLENRHKKMALEGATKTAIKNTTRLDIIADDPKMIEACVMIVKEMAIKYGVDKCEN